jgi:crotonobetainyl-CoA:carnitine CoA-transferase CaiB-like acyl-CoA transferase
LDLSSLWAGPLAAKLLGDRGARVIKAESAQRPDNLRAGRPDLYDELNGDKEHVTFDWSDPGELRALIDKADVVVESSRPRALAQIGIHPGNILLTGGGPRVWASISGYGRSANRVAFGDDAAVAGGLVSYAADGTPRFKGDAIADPLTGAATASEIGSVLKRGGRWLLDIAMAGVAAEVAREGRSTPED